MKVIKDKVGTTDLVVLGIVLIVSIALSVFVTIIGYFGDPADTFIDFALLFGLLWGFYKLGRSVKNGD
jgi:hypothetical protein